MSERIHHMEARSHSQRTAVPPERATAGCGRRPHEGRQDSPAGGVPLGAVRTPSCVKDRAMNRAWLEEQIRVRFDSQGAALVAALHEVQVCVEFPEYYAAILQIYPNETPNGAILRFATARGKQWLS
jgi:hypothetical protein